ELDLPGRACSAVDLTGRRYPVPAGIKNSRRGIGEVRMVQNVEEFCTELQTLTFVNGRGLQQREIHRVILRANQGVPARSSIETECRIGKYAGIVPERRCADRRARRNGTAADAVTAGRVVAIAGHQVGSISRAASKSTYRQTITRKRSGAD